MFINLHEDNADIAFNVIGKIALRIQHFREAHEKAGLLSLADLFAFEMTQQYLATAYTEASKMLETQNGAACMQELLGEGINLPPRMSMVTLSVSQLEEILAQTKATGESSVTVFDYGDETQAFVEIARGFMERHLQLVYSAPNAPKFF